MLYQGVIPFAHLSVFNGILAVRVHVYLCECMCVFSEVVNINQQNRRDNDRIVICKVTEVSCSAQTQSKPQQLAPTTSAPDQSSYESAHTSCFTQTHLKEGRVTAVSTES